MKRLIAVLSGLLVLPAFAEVAPAYYYDDVMEYEDVASDVDDGNVTESATPTAPKANAPVAPATTSPRGTTGRATASRAITSTNSTTPRVTARNNAPSRAVAARTATNTASRGAASRTAMSASTPAATTTTRTNVTNSNATRTITPRRATAKANTARASLVQNDTVNTPLYTGRVGVRSSVTSRMSAAGTGISTSSATTNMVTTVADTTSSVDELAQLTDFCKAQYAQCMDNYCNVLDDNQGRCTCSANLKNYAKVEEALKNMTLSLQEVARQIQYIGLSSEQVEVLLSATEAELTMSSTTDTSKLKNSLESIKKMIVEIKTPTTSSSSGSLNLTSGLNLDLNGVFDVAFDSTGFDMSALFGGSSKTSSITNMRGEQLYKTAVARCKSSVLNHCTAQGVDASVVTNAYDLSIDKACIAYERSLTEANDQMTATVNNAKSVLERARLIVNENKNQYDLRDCITNLDACMQDEFVCGENYENCLDPSGRYIVNGQVVVGSMPGVSGDAAQGNLYKDTWTSNGKSGENTNAWTNSSYTLADYVDDTLYRGSSKTEITRPTIVMSKYIQQKIGYNQDGKDYGMCMSVLNKCQDITYKVSSKKKAEYVYDNNVVREYLQRALIQIKAKQDTVLAEYAENCISDVYSCLTSNSNSYGYFGSSSYTYSTSNILTDTAINACQAQIKSCMSVNGIDGIESAVASNKTFSSIKQVQSWLNTILDIDNVTSNKARCEISGGKWTPTPANETDSVNKVTYGTCNCNPDTSKPSNTPCAVGGKCVSKQDACGKKEGFTWDLTLDKKSHTCYKSSSEVAEDTAYCPATYTITLN